MSLCRPPTALLLEPLHISPVQGWKTGVNGSELWSMLDQSFGWLSSQGYTTKAGAVQKFPIVIGEFGSSLVDTKVRAILPLDRPFPRYKTNA